MCASHSGFVCIVLQVLPLASSQLKSPHPEPLAGTQRQPDRLQSSSTGKARGRLHPGFLECPKSRPRPMVPAPCCSCGWTAADQGGGWEGRARGYPALGAEGGTERAPWCLFILNSVRVKRGETGHWGPAREPEAASSRETGKGAHSSMSRALRIHYLFNPHGHPGKGILLFS